MSEIDAAAEAAYLTDQPRPSWPALLARYQAESQRVLAGPGVMRDIAYGPQRRQVYDLVPAAGAPRGVVAYLLLYNVAFVVPLAVVFAGAYGGLRSERLTGWLRRRAALVKFATAALFTALLALLVLRG